MTELHESAKAMYAPQDGVRYTYDAFSTWADNHQWELIDGTPHAMTVPSIAHQDISRGLFRQLDRFLIGHPCRVYAAPLGVRLNADSSDDTVVQPDLLVVCDRSKLSDGKSCKGAPDLIIEILSPSTARHDRMVKFNLYRFAGVQEFWIVDPDTRLVEAYVLVGGEYKLQKYADTDHAPVHVLPGLEIHLPEVFAEMDVEAEAQGQS